MILSPPRLEKTDAGVRLVANVQNKAFGSREIWYSVPPRWADAMTADRLDAFVVALLPMAVARGEDIHADGAVSTKLFHNLRLIVLPILKMLAAPSATQVHARELITRRESAGAVGTGFSAGIDSFTTLCDHYVHETTPGYRITHMLFNNVGSHGVRDNDAAAALFAARYQRIRGYAEEVGLPLVPVDSNVHAFLPANFQKAHTLVNTSVALLLQPLFRTYYYSSTYHYRHCIITSDSKDIAYADPTLVPALSTESLECISTGGRYSRVDKTRLVSDYAPSHDWLNVCINAETEGRNCSTCSKCNRTLLTLELLGAAEHFTRLFDLQKFAAGRDAYLRDHVLPSQPGSFEHEILALLSCQ